ncbi:MAG: hypothetical protein SO440_10545 [Prevotella sp.]|nr:hypothetical protein [Prevotella sp.]
MNRINNYVLNGAIALLSTAGLVACSSSDDVTDAPVNPTYDGKSVKTQFAINIATPVTGNPSTRMSGANTQNGTGALGNTNSFLGMNNILLMPFKSADVLNVTKSDVARTSDTEIDRVISLANIGTTELSGSQSSKVYYDVNIPINTTQFLFYGTGPIGDTNDKRFESGALSVPSNVTNNTLSGKKLSDIKYSLVTCLGVNNGYETKAGQFASFLNDICDASCTFTSSGGTETTYNWNNLSSYSSSSTKFATLHTAYTNFTKIGSTGVRAGSGPAVLYVLQELFDVCQGVLGGSIPTIEPTTSAEEKLAWAIYKKITTNTNIAVTATSGVLAYSNDADKTFPVGTYAIPEGAAQLQWDNSSRFSYVSSAHIGGNEGNTIPKLSFDPNKVTFPAALTYFVNTPARATTKELVNSDWPATVTSWDSAWDGTSGGFNDWTGSVNSNSRTVALQYNINYGVANLATTVQCKEGVTYLVDNSEEVAQETSNRKIKIPTNGFKVTGIIVGGQSQTVGWDFLNPTSNDQKYVIYDKDINGSTGMYAKASTPSATNYTLVFDNYVVGQTGTTAATDQQKVKIAIELENDVEEFYGVDGKIGKNQKFYLVAELDPNATNGVTKTNITWPDDKVSRFPAKSINRVFIQDYTTTAKFTINSLKNAYVTIPDLRASKLQLGLSVDLTWQSGLTFEVPID